MFIILVRLIDYLNYLNRNIESKNESKNENERLIDNMEECLAFLERLNNPELIFSPTQGKFFTLHLVVFKNHSLVCVKPCLLLDMYRFAQTQRN